MVTREGLAKVLDFGLAKHVALREPAGSLAAPAPAAAGLTASGVQVGTLGYMSPEQLLTPAHDRRSDVFAFGCVLYECLTSTKAFGGIRLRPSCRPRSCRPSIGNAFLPTHRLESARSSSKRWRRTCETGFPTCASSRPRCPWPQAPVAARAASDRAPCGSGLLHRKLVRAHRDVRRARIRDSRLPATARTLAPRHTDGRGRVRKNAARARGRPRVRGRVDRRGVVRGSRAALRSPRRAGGGGGGGPAQRVDHGGARDRDGASAGGQAVPHRARQL